MRQIFAGAPKYKKRLFIFERFLHEGEDGGIIFLRLAEGAVADFRDDEPLLCGGGGGGVERLHHGEGHETVGGAVDEEDGQPCAAYGLHGSGGGEPDAGPLLADEVGEVKARAIVEFREKYGEFRSIDELTLIEGIGEITLEANRDRITV